MTKQESNYIAGEGKGQKINHDDEKISNYVIRPLSWHFGLFVNYTANVK
jgi:hypothetical protein